MVIHRSFENTVRRSKTVLAATAVIAIVTLASVAEAGDACCKAEAARRALVADPFAVKPTNWDDEDDGPWEAPKVSPMDLPAWYRVLRETRLGVLGAAPWLITGVLAAALLTTVLKPLFPSSVLRSWLGSNSSGRGNAVTDSIKGSLFGLLVPFCSCGALPLAMALKQEGISPSSIAAFVTAAQAAGIDSLFFTYGIFGARVALFRLAAAGVLAFSVGITLATTDQSSDSSTRETSHDPVETKPTDERSCCNGSNDDGCRDWSPKTPQPVTVTASVVLFFHTAVELFSSAAVWVFFGVVVSACSSVYVPPLSSAASVDTSSVTFSSAGVDAISVAKSIASRAGLFLVSLPMTICEHGIVSLADALRGLGFSAGTAVALIVTGPSTNVGTLLMLSSLASSSSSNHPSTSRSSSAASGSNWIIGAAKLASVVLVFGVTLSYLADDFGSSILVTKTETGESSGGGSSLPEW
eukprot:CAMPEP_0201152700 /NCGR_PEP_ID=MMETSP0851-20130426/13308_1 /ASSEMBLY_ACC=CAM_ASM_000631 /TAXON_ID=183588 /ORGANISM="Pseudo-nitzschia fraudulenta, Strain WWA7" /LENGTH=467 /DNA_ID=CAMNT_0047429773 /DNA_START=72 /DNA_END=1472 /DNA_ORIENTATION=+